MKLGGRRRRGVALLVLLMAVALCAMMLGAFLQSNRGYLDLFRRGQAQDAVSDATRSLFEFARSSLEKNKGWGRPLASDKPEQQMLAGANRELSWIEHKRESSSALEGRITGHLSNGLVFRLDVLNNFFNSSAVQAGDGGNGAVIAPKAARVRIRVYQNPESLPHGLLLERPGDFVFLGGANALVRNAAFFDAGLIASTGIELHANRMAFHSKDSVRNEIRSNSHIKLPDVTSDNLSFAFLRDLGGGNWQPYTPRGAGGTAWAQGDIRLGGDSSTDMDKLAQAAAHSSGNFVPNAMTHNDIPELAPSDIATTSNRRPLRSGIYVFTTFWAQHGLDASTKRQIPVLFQLSSVDHDDNPDTPQVQQFDDAFYLRSSLPGGDHENTTFLANDDEHGVPVPIPYKALTGEDGADLRLPDSDGDFTGLTVNLHNRKLGVEPGMTLEVEGDFVVQSTDLRFDEDGNLQEPPRGVSEVPVTLELGDDNERSAIKAAGSIVVEGKVKGRGSMLAEGNVVLQPNKVDLATDTVSDLALYAGRNVVIDTPTNLEAEGDVAFRGLVYAEHNFFCRSNTNMEIEGALVARRGHIYLLAGEADVEHHPFSISDIRATKDLTVTYNPDFLDSLLNPETQSRTKVEIMAWRPGFED